MLTQMGGDGGWVLEATWQVFPNGVNRVVGVFQWVDDGVVLLGFDVVFDLGLGILPQLGGLFDFIFKCFGEIDFLSESEIFKRSILEMHEEVYFAGKSLRLKKGTEEVEGVGGLIVIPQSVTIRVVYGFIKKLFGASSGVAEKKIKLVGFDVEVLHVHHEEIVVSEH